MAKINTALMCEEAGSDEKQYPYMKRVFSGLSAPTYPFQWEPGYISAQVQGSKGESLEVSVSVQSPDLSQRQIGERRQITLTQDGEAWVHIKLRPVMLDAPGDYVFHVSIGADTYEVRMPAIHGPQAH